MYCGEVQRLLLPGLTELEEETKEQGEGQT